MAQVVFSRKYGVHDLLYSRGYLHIHLLYFKITLDVFSILGDKKKHIGPSMI